MAGPGGTAGGTAEVFTADCSPVRALHRLTGLVAERVRGCSGASATLWEVDEVAVVAASHPELATLAERQFTAGNGPVIATLRTEQPSVTADTLAERRWPVWTAAALAAGVRSSATLVQPYGPQTLTLSLYGVRPEAFDLDRLPLMSLLAAFGTTVVASAAEHGSPSARSPPHGLPEVAVGACLASPSFGLDPATLLAWRRDGVPARPFDPPGEEAMPDERVDRLHCPYCYAAITGTRETIGEATGRHIDRCEAAPEGIRGLSGA